MSNNSFKFGSNKKPENKSNNIETEKPVLKKLSLEQIRQYNFFLEDNLSAQAHILSRKYDISFDEAKQTLELFKGDNKRVTEIIDYFFKVAVKYNKLDKEAYSEFVKYASSLDFSLAEKETSLLAQEVMNFENKFNLKRSQSQSKSPRYSEYYRDVPGSSVHYDEHFASRTDRESD